MVEIVKISSTAQNEFEDSSEWYEEQSPGLGDYFAETIYSSLNSILKNPELYNKRKANNREFVVDKFPFIIVYQFLKKKILFTYYTFSTPAVIQNINTNGSKVA